MKWKNGGKCKIKKRKRAGKHEGYKRTENLRGKGWEI